MCNLVQTWETPDGACNPQVYNTRKVTTASATGADATVPLRRTNLRPDLAFLALTADEIDLTPLYLKFTWADDVTIADMPNVRSLTFHFVLHPPRMGSDMVQRPAVGGHGHYAFQRVIYAAWRHLGGVDSQGSGPSLVSTIGPRRQDGSSELHDTRGSQCLVRELCCTSAVKAVR
jgi:hypothetical protein